MLILRGTPGDHRVSWGVLVVPSSGQVYTHSGEAAAELVLLGFTPVDFAVPREETPEVPEVREETPETDSAIPGASELDPEVTDEVTEVRLPPTKPKAQGPSQRRKRG
jgi:hypothetical protein